MGKRTETEQFITDLRFMMRRYRRVDTALAGCLRYIKRRKI